MDKYQFGGVIKEIRASFDRVDMKLTKLEKLGMADKFLDVWFRIFKDLDQKETLEAVQDLIMAESKPRDVEDFAVRIRKIVKERQVRRPKLVVDGQQTFSCEYAHTDRFILAFLDNDPDRRHRPTAVRCPKCDDDPTIKPFDPAYMTRWTPEEERRRMANYVPRTSHERPTAKQEPQPIAEVIEQDDSKWAEEMNAQAEALAEREAIQQEEK